LRTAVYTLSLHDALPIWSLPNTLRRTKEKGGAFRFADLSEYTFKQRLGIRAADLGFFGLISVLARTVRFEVEGREHWSAAQEGGDRKSTRLNSSHSQISY